jgi:hypothetical protein
MSEEHTDNLKKARARLIEQRRAFVKLLAGPYERGKTEQARERFLETQTAILDTLINLDFRVRRLALLELAAQGHRTGADGGGKGA